METIGIKNEKFSLKDNTVMTGVSVCLAQKLDEGKGKGVMVEKIFLSKAKLDALPFKLELGMELEILYNRYGKVQTLRLLDDGVDFGTGGK